MNNIVINQHGADIDFAAACKMMDSAIAADMDYGDGLTAQEFFNAYCILHSAFHTHLRRVRTEQLELMR